MTAPGDGAQPRDDPPPRTGDGRSVLVHLGAGIGNLVFATPLVAALDAMGFAIDLLLLADYPQSAELFRGWSAVRRVHRGTVPPKERYDVRIPAVPPFYWPRVARGYRDREDAVARPPDALYYRDEQAWYRAFAEALGWPASRRPVYRLPIAADESHGVGPGTLVLAPGCKTGEMAAKRWPHFAALAERFADVAVVGTADDLRTADGAPLAFPSHVRPLAGRLTLRETAEALAAAGAVVANDSGLGHVAGAVGAPTVLLFGPTSEAVLGAFPDNVTVLRGGLPCEPCWTTARLRACAARVDCLRALSIDRVVSAIHQTTALAPTSAPSPSAPSPSASPRLRVRPSIEAGPARKPEDAGDAHLPLVSCLMPTADRRRFVPRAIEHFLRQDHPHRELVIVDDGDDAVADLVPDDPRIRYERTPRARTLGAKRNLAASLARGTLLAHWDDDDWMADDRLTRQVAALGDADACGLSVVRFFDPVRGRAWEYHWDETRPWAHGATLLYRRSLWERHPFPALDVGEDTRWVWSLPAGALRASRDGAWFASLVHDRNTSRKQTTGPRWRPVPLDTVRGAMGGDWAFYAGMGAREPARIG